MFFHGTNVDLPIGAILVPGVELDSSNYGRSSHVYVTHDGFMPEDPDVDPYDVALREAFAWARTACMIAEESSDEEQSAFVYIVEPLGAVEEDGSEDVGAEAVRTSSARIVGVMDHYDLEEYLPSPFHGESYLNL